MQALGSHWSSFTVFHRKKPSGNQKDSEEDFWQADPEHDLSPVEVEVLRRLSGKKNRTKQTDSQQPSAVRHRQCLAQVIPDIFFDMACRVVKVFSKTRDDQVILLVSDFTQNRLVVCDTEAMEVDSFLLHSALPVTCWDGNVLAAERLQAGQSVLISNLHARLVEGRLVASLHSDSRSKISLLSQSEADALTQAQEALRSELRRLSDLQLTPVSLTSTFPAKRNPLKTISSI